MKIIMDEKPYSRRHIGLNSVEALFFQAFLRFPNLTAARITVFESSDLKSNFPF